MKNNSRRGFIKTAGASLVTVPLIGSTVGFTTSMTEREHQKQSSSAAGSCDYRLLRHAAAVFNYDNLTFLIDPMLNQAVSSVQLPVDDNELTDILNSLDAVLLTHAHTDHINLDSWHINLLRNKPFFCQSSADGNYLTSIGMNDVRVIGNQISFNNITINKTGGQHGINTGWDVSGFVFSAPGNHTVYIAGDTTYATPVADALETYQPDVTIVNTGAVGPASNPWTMTAEDVGSVANKLPSTQIIAVHMEVHPNARLTRNELRQYTDSNNISDRVLIPNDGDSINLCNVTSIDEITLENDIIGIAPNPFKDSIKLDVPGQLLHIRVLDINGKLITTLYKPTWDGTNKNGQIVRNGLYILLISTNDGIYSQRVVKE